MQLNTDRVRAERGKRAWSQGQLAQVSGLGLRTVQRIESSGTASFESATALASVLEIGVGELIDSSNEPQRKKTLLALCASSAFALLAALLYGNAFADDGLLLDYVYEKVALDDTSKTESKFLLQFDETATADLGGRLKIVFRGEEHADSVELEVAVYEYTEGEQESLVGRGIASTQFGEPLHYSWKETGAPDYSLTVIPTRSTIAE